MPVPRSILSAVDEIEQEKVEEMPTAVEEPRQEEHGVKEEKVFDTKREKLLAQLAKAREKSAAVRKARKAEKQAAKRPPGRPSKKVVEVDTGSATSTPPPAAAPAAPAVAASAVDYDRIINGVHQKYLDSKAQRKKSASTAVHAGPVPAVNLDAFEQRIRRDEQSRLAAEVERRKQERDTEAAEKARRLKDADRQYFSRLPPPTLGRKNYWDRMFE